MKKLLLVNALVLLFACHANARTNDIAAPPKRPRPEVSAAADTVIHEYADDSTPTSPIEVDSTITTTRIQTAPMGPMPGSPLMLIVILGGLIAAAIAIFFVVRKVKA
ncbi:MAG: hypothetical protein RLZZ519_1000 [Bacteroidota bacterium]|jgi:hypothetical protein